MADATISSLSQRHAPGRLAGVDIARALALIGMLMVHFGPDAEGGLAGALYGFPHGRASLLFAVVAGVGMALLTRRPEARALARLRLLWFALILLPLGLALQRLDHPVAVILHHYAIFFVFGLLICGLSRAGLLALALVCTFVGPLLYLMGRMEAYTLFARRSVEGGDTLLAIGQALLIAGPYPLLTWAGPIAFGMVLGRCALDRPATRWIMLGAGIGMALATAPLAGLALELFGEPASRSDWRQLFASFPHSQMPLWLINATAMATATIGGALIVGDRLGRLAVPAVTLGRFALSVYVAHLIVLAGWQEAVQRETPGAAMAHVLIFIVFSTLAAMAWQARFGPRGPVEWLLHAPWEAMRRLALNPEARKGPAARDLPTPN